MNYLTEHKSFYVWLRRHHRNTDFQSFWNYLLVRNSAAAFMGEDGVMYWPVWYQVENDDIRVLLDEEDAKRIWEHRRKLIDAGLIEYQPASGGKCGEYALIPFERGVTRLQIIPQAHTEPVTVWNPPQYRNQTEAGKLSDPLAEQEQLSSDYNTINNKCLNTEIAFRYQGEAALPPDNQLPMLNSDEMNALKAIHQNDAALLEAMWSMKQQKAYGEEEDE